ncbi:uncharacterized protein LOC132061332 [Lycium ferocissimum]|uniref:uncharacterized protein LOC132061332 n=1 Tax=Lycium ferocissimum TaxID=112874 RepID=UPI002815F4C8|nr:uncharacterized protein LOC132061332 [Lycium ferocissimum]
MCFMAKSDTSEVRTPSCSKCIDLQATLDLVTDDLQKMIDEYNKLAKEKKNWQIQLEASQIEVDLLEEELGEIKMQLNSIKKSPSHSSNGVIERKNRSLQDTAKTMLLEQGLPDRFWAEAVPPPKIPQTQEIEGNSVQEKVDKATSEPQQINLLGEWRSEASYPNDFILGDLKAKIQTRASHKQMTAVALISQLEPKKVDEALNDKSCITAMQEELDQFERNQVWKLVPRPKNVYVIGTKWVFRNKLNESRQVIRNKAQLVAQGYSNKKVSTMVKLLLPLQG